MKNKQGKIIKLNNFYPLKSNRNKCFINLVKQPN